MKTGDVQSAPQRQETAAARLRTALERLSRLEAETDQALGEQSLAAIRDDLTAIRKGQVEPTVTVQIAPYQPIRLRTDGHGQRDRERGLSVIAQDRNTAVVAIADGKIEIAIVVQVAGRNR